MVVRKVESKGRSSNGSKFDLQPGSDDTVIVVSRKGAAINGSVELDRTSREYPRGMATLLPDPPHPTDTAARKRLQGTNTFAFEHLEPGTYRLCAWLEEGTEINHLLANPNFQKQLAGPCKTVDVSGDDAKSVNLNQFSALDIR
jgi:hypothetical protein